MFPGTGVEVYSVHRSGKGALTSVFKIAKIIKNGGYEIVSIQRGHDIIQSWVASLLSFRNPVLTYTVQVPEFLRSRFLLRKMDRITTISRYIAEKIASFDPAVAQRTIILYYGIDLGKFKPEKIPSGWFKNCFGISPHTKVIATVGDLEESNRISRRACGGPKTFPMSGMRSWPLRPVLADRGSLKTGHPDWV
jgi:glycosyltransferase involved in cell wall biosynthesis